MKKLAFILCFCIGLGFALAQNQEDPDVSYRVEKEYDEQGNLIRYDSTRVTSSPHFSKQFSFFFKKDSLGNTSHFGFPHHNFKLDSLHRSINFDSIIYGKLLSIQNRIKDLDLDSLRDHEFFFDGGDWLHKRHPDFYELEKRLQTLDSLMQHKLESFEALFDKFEEHNGKI